MKFFLTLIVVGVNNVLEVPFDTLEACQSAGRRAEYAFSSGRMMAIADLRYPGGLVWSCSLKEEKDAQP